MGKHLTYPEHKHTSVEWFPTVPGSWDVLYARRIFKQVREAAKPDDEQLATTQKYGVIPQRLFMEYQDQKVVLALSGTDNFKHVEIDDFVISLRSFQGGIERCHYKGCVSPAYTVMRRTKPIEPSYFSYLLKSEGFITALQAVTQGIREGKTITFDQFGGIPLPFPSHQEQQHIATFLNHETAKIDRLIAKQERLIELLKEKRQAVISHAVTKGLNPDAPMKDSGVEWLGEVPAHWGTCALGYLANIDTGATPDRGNPDYWNGDIPWLKTGEVNYNVIMESEEHITKEGLLNSSTRLARIGTLLMAMYGQGVTRGRVSILGIEATYNQACAAIRVGRSLFNEYTYFFLMAAYSFIRETGNETSQMNLSAEIIGKVKMTIPPAGEQQEIVSYLREKLPAFDLLADKAKRSIELAKEHRTALISAAVTGKIDVRAWQKPNTESEQTAKAVSA